MSSDTLRRDEDETLAELLDEVLNNGIVADADVALSIGDVELVRLSARLLAATVFRLQRRPISPEADGSDA